MKVRSSQIPMFAVVCLLFTVFLAPGVFAQESPTSKDKELYNQLKAFSLTGGVIEAKGLVIKLDRVELTLDGLIYLSEPINGRTTGAVFIGEGKFAAETPPDEFEKDN